jgi:hypothetical protein
MAETSINHLTQLVTCLEDYASGTSTLQGSLVQRSCRLVTLLNEYQGAVLFLEENLPGFKERVKGDA